MEKAICPRCKRTTLVFQIHAPADIKAVCRHNRKCGFRSRLIRDGFSMPAEEVAALVTDEYLSRCAGQNEQMETPS